MTWKRTNPEPTLEQLAAWADGELDHSDAERVEAWLALRPEAAGAAEAAARMVQLYRDHPAPEPSERAWQAALTGVQARLAGPAPPSRRWGGPRRPLRLLLGLAVTAAAVFGGMLLARTFWTGRPVAPEHPDVVKTLPPAGREAAEEEPFPVSAASEVNIISIDVDDANRVVMMGQPPMGAFELAAPEDIEIVKMAPREDGWMPRLRRGPEVPMIVVAAAGNSELDPSDP
jgi:anti-sigma factor RsiW